MTEPSTPAPSPASPKKAKKPLWRRMLKWSIRALVVLVVLGLTTYAGVYYWAAKTINGQISQIRAAGEPLTFDDLVALAPKVERSQDAGPYYLAAAELVDTAYQYNDSQQFDDAHWSVFFDLSHPAVKISPDDLAWAHRAVELNRLPLDLVDRGSALPGCGADIRLRHGIAVALSRLARLRELLDECSLRTRVLAAQGQTGPAIASLQSSAGLLRVLDHQPIVLDYLVQVAMQCRICDDARFILERPRSEADLQKLEEALKQVHVAEPRRVFLAERVYAMERMRNLIAHGTPATPEDSNLPTLPERQTWAEFGMTGRLMVAYALPIYVRYIDVASKDWPELIPAIQDIADKPNSIWDKIDSPSLTRSIILSARSMACYRSTLVALRIEIYRLAHNGQLPQNIEQLPDFSGLPTDPFTGRPLMYLTVPDGYCIFSAGRGNPNDDSTNRDADPIKWSSRWGIHIRTNPPQ